MHPRWWPIFQQPTSYQLIVHGSLKHLLNLSPLLHLYSLSQSQDFSPGFPQIPPASLVSNFISLLVILYLMPAWTWTHEDLSTPLPFFKRSSLPGCLLLSLYYLFQVFIRSLLWCPQLFHCFFDQVQYPIKKVHYDFSFLSLLSGLWRGSLYSQTQQTLHLVSVHMPELSFV